MTRGRDVFWGALAALTPILFTVGVGYLEQIAKDYVAHTYQMWPWFMALTGINLVYGLIIAALAVRFGGRQQVEISCMPVVGMLIGWLYSVCNVLMFFVVYSGIPTKLGTRMIMYSGGKGFFFAGFYSVLLILYWKRYHMITKEDFISEKA